MKSGKVATKKAAGAKARSLSTSHARAHFAAALDSAHSKNAVIGFDRYGQPIAALVPIDAVRMLAGQEGDVAPDIRARIARTAAAFLGALNGRRKPRKPPAPAKKAKKRAAPRAKLKPRRRMRRKTVGKSH